MTSIDVRLDNTNFDDGRMDLYAVRCSEQIVFEVEQRLAMSPNVFNARLVLVPTEFRVELSRKTVRMSFCGVVNNAPFDTSWNYVDNDDFGNPILGLANPVQWFIFLLSYVIANGMDRERSRRSVHRTIVANATAKFVHAVNQAAGSPEPEIADKVRTIKCRLWLPYVIGFLAFASVMAMIEFGNPANPFVRPQGNQSEFGKVIVAVVVGVYGGFLPACAYFAFAIACLPSNEITTHPSGAELMSLVGVDSVQKLRWAGLIMGLIAGAAFTGSLYWLAGRMWQLPL